MTQLPALGNFDYTVDVTIGQIDFRNFSDLLSQATQLADWLSQVQLNEENAKEGKKLVAKVRKKVDELKKYRLEIQRAYNRPMQDFTDRINTISDVVSQGEETVRRQLRELEEIRRDQKEAEIKEIWDKRARQYPCCGFDDGDYTRFMQPKYLNKTCSIHTVENEMVAFFEAARKDLEFIERMDIGDGETAHEVYERLNFDITNVNIPEKETKTEEPVHVSDRWVLRLKNPNDLGRACAALDRESIDYDMVNESVNLYGRKRMNG